MEIGFVDSLKHAEERHELLEQLLFFLSDGCEILRDCLKRLVCALSGGMVNIYL